jgi:hypothetical protein
MTFGYYYKYYLTFRYYTTFQHHLTFRYLPDMSISHDISRHFDFDDVERREPAATNLFHLAWIKPRRESFIERFKAGLRIIINRDHHDGVEPSKFDAEVHEVDGN